MSSSNCCFLACIQVSQEVDKVVWYSHIFKNFPQFDLIHTVKGFSVANKTKVDVFLEISCFFCNPTDVSNLISGPSAFSKFNLNIWKFLVNFLNFGWFFFFFFFYDFWTDVPQGLRFRYACSEKHGEEIPKWSTVFRHRGSCVDPYQDGGASLFSIWNADRTRGDLYLKWICLITKLPMLDFLGLLSS